MATKPNANETRAQSAGIAMLETLRKGTKNQRVIKWPGTENAELILVPLTCDQLQEAYAAALERFKSKGIDVNLFSADDFNSELNMQVLVRAMRCVDNRDVCLFSDADELRSAVFPDERTLVMREYFDLNDQCNPSPDDVPQATLDQIYAALKKKDATSLIAFGSYALATCLLTMDNQQAS